MTHIRFINHTIYKSLTMLQSKIKCELPWIEKYRPVTLDDMIDHQEKITIGNLIGSNIYNLSLIGGIILLISSWKPISFYEIFMLLTATLTFTIIVVSNKGKIIPKYTGFVLIILFCTYIYFLK